MNRSASLAMSTSVLKALPGKLDIKRHSPSILYLHFSENCFNIAIKGDKDDIQNGRDCMPFIRSKAKFPDCTPSKTNKLRRDMRFPTMLQFDINRLR